MSVSHITTIRHPHADITTITMVRRLRAAWLPAWSAASSWRGQ